MLDETHDPNLRSWVESANMPGCDFPIQNLPLGRFRKRDDATPRLGTAIGSFVLEVGVWLPGDDLAHYMALSASARRDLRRLISRALGGGAPARPLLAQSDCEMLLPVAIGDYTDFYASIDHAANVGRLFRPDNPLLPNYKHVPIGYHGRTSSIVLSGTPVRRPAGQLGPGDFAASRELDYEIELAAFLGPSTIMGNPVPIRDAEQYIVGVCLLNDWSARDIQRWEYQPLGPFLGKNFATSISPWVVTFEALEPFRTDALEHETPPLPYLAQSPSTAFEITLEVWLRTPSMTEAIRVSGASFKDMYWTLAQLVAHHTSNGCPLRVGDLIASGTVSGPEKINRGCLLELTSRGSDPIDLGFGEKRGFLKDGDEVILRGYCHREGFARIGLGECRGTILPN